MNVDTGIPCTWVSNPLDLEVNCISSKKTSYPLRKGKTDDFSVAGAIRNGPCSQASSGKREGLPLSSANIISESK